jgi:hypothetical protein
VDLQGRVGGGHPDGARARCQYRGGQAAPHEGELCALAVADEPEAGQVGEGEGDMRGVGAVGDAVVRQGGSGM